jgi:CRP-like cAMP-binding protein
MSAPSSFAAAVAGLTGDLSSPLDVLALGSVLVAAALVVVSAFVRTMIPLRWLAVGGNVGFLVYGALHPAPVMALLHGALLPINVWRATDMVRLTRRVSAAAAAQDLSGVWLKPYMRKRRYRAGQVLFHKGDAATHLYFLADGRIVFEEIHESMEAGALFGEIAFFAPDRKRSLTARCLTHCTVLCIDETTFQQLYFQNPSFGFQIVTLVAGRLMADQRRLQDQLAAARAPAPLPE